MFTSAQNQRLDTILKNNSTSIRDLALLSLASTQNHPRIINWRSKRKTHAFDFAIDFKLPIFIPHVPPVYCLQYIGDCYYIGMGNGPIFCTMTLRELILQGDNVQELCLECLQQISSVLKHLNDKGIFYVHGNLNVDTVVRSSDGRFYIVDNGFPKIPLLCDPFMHYRLPNHDLRTLCESMSSLMGTETLLTIILLDGKIEFRPAIFRKYLEDNMQVFKRSLLNTQ